MYSIIISQLNYSLNQLCWHGFKTITGTDPHDQSNCDGHISKEIWVEKPGLAWGLVYPPAETNMAWTNNQKERFIINEFFNTSVSGAFQRHKIYIDDTEERRKREFGEWLKKQLIRLLDEYQNIVSEPQHIKNIQQLKDSAEQKYNDILFEGRITFGTCQKLINLWLKYFWSIEKIPTPPHCPFDGRIISVLEKEYKKTNKLKIELTPWTKANLNDYEQYLKISKDILGNNRLAEWELIEFNNTRD